MNWGQLSEQPLSTGGSIYVSRPRVTFGERYRLDDVDSPMRRMLEVKLAAPDVGKRR